MTVRLPALCTRRPLPRGRFLVLISVRSWVYSRTILRLEGLGQLKNLMTWSGIEPAIPRRGELSGQYNFEQSGHVDQSLEANFGLVDLSWNRPRLFLRDPYKFVEFGYHHYSKFLYTNIIKLIQCRLLGCGEVQILSEPTFRRNLSPPSTR
jgi:hypothetical protein